MIIEKATLQDAESILAIQKEAYIREAITYNNYEIAPLTETLEEMKDDFKQKTVLKAILNEKVVGSVKGYVEKGTCYVERLMVDPASQGQGIGKKLMLDLETYFPDCERFELYTGGKSTYNIRFYEKLGYTIFKTEMIRENIDFVFMEKQNSQNN
ncbi:GNAT family N-acetyltransferase [Halalkalibacter nanhaiisediminis]|uniref:L-amino acid N-acyltransferase YncA n=1 Tax=Halalkalibacter nanhaiisediminis TaxID=688079 RepID=A0A562QDD0_9BACI|nr:GNAT family N-acetyltransferase [Halalkalibacter nanhaiisediminis]TWI54713.1 L-amino acid N-acyltransferase YncA [Halalkalibacter nanhaiisediminis]